ncbi:DUF6702 family protein [Kaistella palustris]|uniref:DUF6702 family protein n=1 Tax=Kaistella palustris TaxID=493376 RepID=UPI00041FE0FE|nr:DUF6702 family protein [Kaistella palustris]
MQKVFLLFLLTFCAFSPAKDLHPYHVGSVEFNYNTKSKTFQITGKFFLDDLENALNEKYGAAIHFNEEKYRKQINENLRKYCLEYLKLKADGHFLKVNYVGYEEENESVNIFLESEPVQSPKKVETAVSFLYNFFDDQMNIIHIIVNGKRQSEKLDYPNR